MRVDLTVPFDTPLAEIRKLAEKKAGIKNSSFFALVKKSVDARKAALGTILCNYVIALSPSDMPYCYQPVPTQKQPEYQPIVVGFGPAGMFCALALAEQGLKPIVFEQGEDVDARQQKVQNFWKTGKLDTQSNVQFGEGGAGLFSDGKLMTQSDSPFNYYVLSELVKYGASEDCLYYKHAHVGSDKLITIVKGIRQRILKLGGEIYFNSFVSDVSYNNQYASLKVGEKEYKTKHLILAIGHSARNTYKQLTNKLICQPKGYAVGVRIEHLQQQINQAQYKKLAKSPLLGSAEYKLTANVKGRGCYSFCMCPGGMVVASQSEENTVVTNGMSLSTRNGINANSAIVVSVNPEDYGNTVEGALDFQRQLEQKAFILAGSDYSAPVQLLGDFIKGNQSVAFGEILPTYKPNVKFARLDNALPDFVSHTIKQAMPQFAEKLKGFVNYDAPLSGFETRTSSPIRLLRDVNTFKSVSSQFIYPVGEGCGYAGGIISSAADGVKIANAIGTLL